MTRIADLMDRDFSTPVEEAVSVHNHDPHTVFTELTEYVATNAIQAAYECLFSAIAAASKSPHEGVGIWISGVIGSGKSAFAKNLGYVLANRELPGLSASSLFLKQVDSKRVAESVEFLNRAVLCEVCMCDVQLESSAQPHPEHIAETIYRALRRDLDYAADAQIAEVEFQLEREGKLAVLPDLCRAEYREDWRTVREGSENSARTSVLLHRLDPRTYASADTWLKIAEARHSSGLSVEDLVSRIFDLCEMRHPGKTLACIVDDAGEYAALGAERLEHLRAVVEQFGKQSLARLKAGKIPGPAWIVFAADESLEEYSKRLTPGEIDLHRLQHSFQNQIDLSAAGIGEVAARRVLRKKESQEAVLRKLFEERGAALLRNVKLEGCSRRTAFDEDEFVRFYPYLPHLIEISIDAAAGIRRHPNSPKHPRAGNRTIVKQAFEMLVSDRSRFADRPVGALVSIDKIYDLLEASLPVPKCNDILDIRQRLDDDKDYPGMAGRVAKAICLMEFAKTDLRRTAGNIAALLIERVNEAPPVCGVAAILYRMKEARFIRESQDGWELYDFDQLRRVPDALVGLGSTVGAINPRLPGWRNDLIQLIKKALLRGLAWYTRPSQAFHSAVIRSLDRMVWSLDHLSTKIADHRSMNVVAYDRLSMDIVALERRLAQTERRLAAVAEPQAAALAGFRQAANPEQTAYVIGLFGTGRRYINRLIVRNIGERVRYFRDTIRFHPGPTPMIYSGHATMRYTSRNQEPPEVTKRILAAVDSGFANLTFVYRHPLDSLLTNWVWWRTFLRDYKSISGISRAYRNTDDLCADLERDYFEFKAFADGDPDFFAGAPGPRFLSFPEFVEETELYLHSATLALRLEDFMIDPRREFGKIAEVMSVDPDLSRLSLDPPRTKPYGHLAVKEKVPRFRSFINGLNTQTKRRMERIGYEC